MDIMQNLNSKLTTRQRNSKVERIWSRKQIEQAFIETFELVGGVPRLALWANDPDNYGEFLKLLMRLAPKEAVQDVAQVLEYRSMVPSSPLNRPRDEIEEGDFTDAES